MTAWPSVHQWHRDVPADLRLPTLLGLAILLLCIGGFGVWAAIAPLEGAIVVSGSFVATGQNKLHPAPGGRHPPRDAGQGGRSGRAGPAAAAPGSDRRHRPGSAAWCVRKYRLIIMKARLEAEIDGQAVLRMPETPCRSGDGPGRARRVRSPGARAAGAARRNRPTKRRYCARRSPACRRAFAATRRRRSRRPSGAALFAEELKDKQGLLARQLARKTEVLAVQRAEAGLSGELGELLARIADSKERIARAEQQIAQVRSAAMQKAIEDLRATETELDDVQEQARAAQDVVDRVEVRAPVRGIVVKLNQHTLRWRHCRRRRHPRAAAGQRRADHRSPDQPERDLAREGGPAAPS